MDCSKSPLAKPVIVAVATDKYLTPTYPFPDTVYLPTVSALKFGPDITFGYGRAAPQNETVGTSIADLKAKMTKLLDKFAAADRAGMARALFNEFLAGHSSVSFYSDPTLDKAAANHGNIKSFCTAAMSIPGPPPVAWGRGSPKLPPPRRRIHQALQQVGWDVTKIAAPTDLGVPAFNNGSTTFSTGDYDNGLGLMINGVQYVYVLATHYLHDAKAARYCIGLRFLLYDVFGLDDDDLAEYGASDNWSFDKRIGITAWWQLQHQFGFAPLVTRVIVDRTFEGPAT